MPKQDSQRTSLLKIFTTNFLDLLGFGLVIPVYGFLFYPDPTQGGLFTELFSADQLTQMYVVLLATFSVGTLIGAPFIGALSDKYGRRTLLMFTYSMNIVFYFCFILGLIKISYIILLISRLGAGLTGGSLLVVNSAIADVSAPEEKAKNFGITGVAFGLGFIIGAVVGGILSNPEWHPWFGNLMPFYAANVVTICNLLFLVFVFKETNHQRSVKEISILTGPRNVFKAFQSSSLRNLFILVFMLTVCFNFFIQLFQFYVMDEFGFDRSQVGYLFGFIGISIALSQGLILPWFSNRFKPAQIITYSLPLFAISYLLILIPNQWAWFCAFMVILIVLQALTFPTILSVVSNSASDDIQGETIGINQSVQSLAAATPILFSLLITANYSIPMYAGSIITALAWVFFMLFVKTKNKAKDEYASN